MQNLLDNDYSEVQIAKLLGLSITEVREHIAPARPKVRFSPGKVKWAVEKYKDGHTVQEIADLLGASWSGTYHALKRAGVTFRPAAHEFSYTQRKGLV